MRPAHADRGKGARRTAQALALALLVLSTSGCAYPRDPRGSYEDAAGGTLRVVAVEHDPWVQVEGDDVSGIEGDLIERFARQIDARVEWQHASSEGAAVEALKAGVADVGIGGFSSRSPFAREVATTRPYLETEILAVRPARSDVPILDIEDRRVLHDEQDVELAARIRAAGGQPEPTGKLPPDGLAVVHDWQAAAWDLDRGTRLHRARHVLFVEPGENLLTSKLERFLDTERERVRERLEQEASR